MKTDRELLELAAMAAGLTIMWSEPFKRYERFVLEKYAGEWNPLTDDGDALRLAVKLRLDVLVDTHTVTATTPSGYFATEYPKIISDPYSATRRAIVRAAAAIGERMK